ncbi:MAG: hypothetical protein JXA28_01140 [Bacteroidetes bacterium]|nr:hypothetical protein [Bacteroidota bacterium]
MRCTSIAIVLFAVLLAACSGSEEQVRMEIPPPKKAEPAITPPSAEREFTFNERYFIKNASIDDPENIDDALQAIRVIQLKEGRNQVLVISSFDKLAESSLETWFGIEMPSFSPGTYQLKDARQIAFYRFYLGDERKRIDGESFEGTITIEEEKDGYLTGYIDATVNGVTKSFEEESKPVRVTFSGSFRIQEVKLEDTMMKRR